MVKGQYQERACPRVSVLGSLAYWWSSELVERGRAGTHLVNAGIIHAHYLSDVSGNFQPPSYDASRGQWAGMVTSSNPIDIQHYCPQGHSGYEGEGE